MNRQISQSEAEIIRQMAQDGFPIGKISAAINRAQATVMRYAMRHGIPIIRKQSQAYSGCDEDCFHCKYPDCLMPSPLINTDYTVKGQKI